MVGVDASEEGDRTLFEGTVLDRWRVVRLLGRGGMSMVYEAEHRNGARVALKVLSAKLAKNPRARERFLREGRVANSVGHRNAVRVLDEHEMADGTLFLVLDLLEGKTLTEICRIAGGKLEVTKALRVADGVLEVLAAAHTRGIIHRDIKPQNVFVTTDETVKVLDFGVASVRTAASEDAAITQSGFALGTPAFMAPEQARGRRGQLDARTDVWAVGATLYWCLTGRHVHEDASSANEALIFAATQPAQSVSRFRPELAARVAVVVDRALALNADDRWPSAEAMRRAIRDATKRPTSAPALESTGSWTSDTLPGSGTQPIVRRVPRRSPVLIAAALASCALVILLIHLRSAASEDPPSPGHATAQLLDSKGASVTRASDPLRPSEDLRVSSDRALSSLPGSSGPHANGGEPPKTSHRTRSVTTRAPQSRPTASSLSATTAEQPVERSISVSRPEAPASSADDIPEPVLNRRK